MVNISNNPPIYETRDLKGYKIDKNVTTSHTDKVLDLTNDNNTLKNELINTQDNFTLIKVKDAEGQNHFLNVEGLSKEERLTLINDLKYGILSGNKVDDQFSHVEFVELTQDHNWTLKITGKDVNDNGAQGIQTHRIEENLGTQEFIQEAPVDESSHKAPLSTTDAVVSKSNENKNDQMWSLMNGGFGIEKNGNWKNGIVFKDGKPFVRQSPNSDAGKEIFTEMSMKEYKDMVVNDFNFNGAMDKFENLEDFTASLKAAYPDKFEKFGENDFNLLAANIYSYATKGEDLQGNTDIGQMQGFLYVLDPEIGEASDTNTKMKDGRTEVVDGKEVTRDYKTFTPPGWDGPPLLVGDGYHGRATILTTRFILEKPQPVEAPPDKFSLNVSMDISLPFKMDPDAYTVVTGDVTGSMSGNLTDIERKREEIQKVVGYDVPLEIFINNSTQLTSNAGGSVVVGQEDEIGDLREKGTKTRKEIDGQNTKFGDDTQRESGFNAAMNSIDNINPDVLSSGEFKKLDIVVMVDEPDKDPLALQKLLDQVAELEKSGVDVNVRFINPKTGKEVTLDEIKALCCDENGKVNQDILLNKSTNNKGQTVYDEQEDSFVFDFNRIAPGFGEVKAGGHTIDHMFNPDYIKN